jgi:hypothetical protein
MTRSDTVLLLFTLLLLPLLYLGLWQAGGPATHVRIILPHASPLKLSLDNEGVYAFEGTQGTSKIQVENGMARFIESPCTNKICLHQGWQEHAGEVAACLPNQVAIVMVGGEQRYDAINY